ncbi:MAG: hypothetical protein H5T72_10960 [Actinobacteria bacterium]|nr:hypothetical protein [Actinomycetota bacterium]
MKGWLKGFRGRWWVVAVVLAALALSVPLQYLVRREVVTGMTSGHAHSHAHEHGEERGHEEGGEHAHEAEEEHGEEGHPASDIPLHTNLISNYSFEVGTGETIWGWTKKGEERGALLFRDRERSFRGFASAAVSSQESDFVDAGWYTRLGQTPVGHDVVFRGRVRTENLQGEAYLGILVRGVGESSEPVTLVAAYLDGVEGTTNWTPLELRCYVPLHADEIWMECGMYGRGRVWFDEVSLEVEEREEYPPSGVDLLRNSSFEEGTRYWHPFLSGTGNLPLYGLEPDRSGLGQALRVENRPGTDNPVHTGFFQTIPGLSGREGNLFLRGRIRARSMAGRGWVDALAFGVPGAVDFKASRELAGNTDWEEFEAWVPLDGTVDSLMIRLNVEGAGTLLVDDLQAMFFPAGMLPSGLSAGSPQGEQ